MIKSIEHMATSLVKWLMPLCLLTVVPLVSCEEDDDDDDESADEFENWQQRNDEMLELWAADPDLQKYKNYALNEKATAGQSYLNDFNWRTAYATSGCGWIEGLQTALLKMHVGDRWLIHIPYQLGYGSSTTSSTIPAYSNLIFDVALYDVWHPGETRPPFK